MSDFNNRDASQKVNPNGDGPVRQEKGPFQRNRPTSSRPTVSRWSLNEAITNISSLFHSTRHRTLVRSSILRDIVLCNIRLHSICLCQTWLQSTRIKGRAFIIFFRRRGRSAVMHRRQLKHRMAFTKQQLRDSERQLPVGTVGIARSAVLGSKPLQMGGASTVFAQTIVAFSLQFIRKHKPLCPRTLSIPIYEMD
ncbi:uncharacterized protein N7446_007317 [Penicillium canescens]|uniref:uncharacterized protein n=1 Tax=Penicillium canescens TaxID=5083 RepID=UPI0026DF0D21|nr:uncharacterized protein N7446_007317 [Penicillium canescens]KAJ6063197.1 hypothetical protein N7446_007317 [Penicillium canescens]